MFIKINNSYLYMHRVRRAKNKVNENLEKIEMLKQTYFNKMEDLVYLKRDGGFIHGELLDTLTDLEHEVDLKFNDLVQLNKDFEDDNRNLNRVIVGKNRRYAREKMKGELIKSQKDGTQELKVNQYDLNIVDNMYVIYYFLSYGIIGLFIYKLLKQ